MKQILRVQNSLRARLHLFRQDEAGASLIEFSLVVLLFLFLLFVIIDFGRLANALVSANKATQIAARVAAARPPVCDGVPTTATRGGASPAPNFGTLCRAGTGICADPGDFICSGAIDNATAREIYGKITPLLPPGTEIEQLQFSYTYDPNLGFLGGPYVPMVTVELDNVDFVFVSYLGAFIEGLTGSSSTLGSAPLPVPGMSVSLPGEDLALGTEG